MNLLVLLEVSDRLSLKHDLEIAREIQLAMLPDGTWAAPGVEACGLTRPANTVGGDFYDILPLPDGRVHRGARRRGRQGQPGGAADGAAAGDAAHAGRRAPAAAPSWSRASTFRSSKHAPRVALHHAVPRPVRPARPASCDYVNAGQTPPLLLRASGAVEQLRDRRHRAGDVRAVHLPSGAHAGSHAGRRAGHVQRRHHRGRGARRPDVRRSRAWRRPSGRRRAWPRACSAGRCSRPWTTTAKASGWPTTSTVLVLSRPVVPPVPGSIPAA